MCITLYLGQHFGTPGGSNPQAPCHRCLHTSLYDNIIIKRQYTVCITRIMYTSDCKCGQIFCHQGYVSEKYNLFRANRVKALQLRKARGPCKIFTQKIYCRTQHFKRGIYYYNNLVKRE